jgi:putative transposase
MKIIVKDQLDAEDVRDLTERLLLEHLSLEVSGYKITTSMVLNVLIKAAVEKRSIDAVCKDLSEVVDGNTLREALNRALTVDDLRQHEAEFNAALAACIPVEMPRRGLEMAVDFHDEPYYGKSEATQAYISRGEAQEGTTHFWRIATLYVIWRDVRITLAMTYVLPEEDTTLSVLQRLMQRRASLKFRPRVVYLDKGFCSGDIIRYLQRTNLPALIACTIRGTTGGTRALCRGRKHYRTRYTFSDGTTADLGVVPTLTTDPKTGRQRRTWLMYVIIHLDWSAKVAHQRYQRRFGIESSYRQLGQVRAFSNSRNVALRFFFLALGLLLLNVWTYLRCLCSRILGPGPFRLVVGRFRLAQFSVFVRRAIEQAFGTTMSISIYHD